MEMKSVCLFPLCSLCRCAPETATPHWLRLRQHGNVPLQMECGHFPEPLQTRRSAVVFHQQKVRGEKKSYCGFFAFQETLGFTGFTRKKYTFLNIKFSMFVSILPVKIYRNLNRTLYSRLTFFKVYLTNLKLITAPIEQQLYVNTWGTGSVISTGGWSLWWFITGRGCTEPVVQQVCKATELLGFSLLINPDNAATLSLIPMPRFWLDLVYTVFFFFFFSQISSCSSSGLERVSSLHHWSSQRVLL